MNRSGILSAGAYAIDYIKRVDAFPTSGKAAQILREEISNGGFAYNVLINLVRLGADFKLSAAGWVGQDVDGQAVVEDCKAHHLDIASLRVSKVEHTTYNDVMVRPETGERYILTRMGAHTSLSLWDVSLDATDAKMFYLGPLLGLGELDRTHKLSGTQAAEMLRLAQKAGIDTAVSIIPVEGRAESIFKALKFTDYLFLTEGDVEFLTGIQLRYQSGLHRDAIHEACKQLIGMGVGGAVILQLSEGGLIMNRKGEVTFQRGVNLPLKKLSSFGGVNSAFTAGVLYALHEERPYAEALQLGLGAAAACSMGVSTSGGVRTEKRCLELYHQYQHTPIEMGVA